MKITKARNIFTKIRSSVERRDIFLKMLLQKNNFLCKTDGPSLFRFVPDYIKDNTAIVGVVVNIEGHVASGATIIANWSVGDERYFMQSTLTDMDFKQALIIPEDIYKLQRRAHNRVELPEDIGREVKIIEIKSSAIRGEGECLDISAGGARIAIISSSSPFKKGEKIKATFTIRKKWSFETLCEVKHVKNSDGFQVIGVEFDRENVQFVNKIQMMMLELQRWAVMTYGKTF